MIAFVRGPISDFGRGDVDSEIVVVDVAHHDARAGHADRLMVGDVVERRRDHFVAGPEAGGEAARCEAAAVPVLVHTT